MIRFIRIGPKTWLYFGHEDEIEKSNHVWTPFWFLEESPPFREGNGFRIREGPFEAFHVGLAHPSGKSSHAEIMGDTGQLADISPEEISSWRAPGTTEEHT